MNLLLAATVGGGEGSVAGDQTRSRRRSDAQSPEVEKGSVAKRGRKGDDLLSSGWFSGRRPIRRRRTPVRRSLRRRGRGEGQGCLGLRERSQRIISTGLGFGRNRTGFNTGRV
jgi:hypothetical protein